MDKQDDNKFIGYKISDQPGVLQPPNFYEINRMATPCLLCGKPVSVRHISDVPKVCDKCKRLWKLLKEKYDE